MITFTKGNTTKILSKESSLIEILLADGWIDSSKKEVVKPPKKEVEDGKISTTGN